jgi:hypothetical protein
MRDSNLDMQGTWSQLSLYFFCVVYFPVGFGSQIMSAGETFFENISVLFVSSTFSLYSLYSTEKRKLYMTVLFFLVEPIFHKLC